MKILITGHPRSGTKSIAQMLKRIGCDAHFENDKGKITVSWKHIKSGYNEGFTNSQKEIKYDFDKVIHQVRHPLKVIASSTTLSTVSFKHLASVVKFPDRIVDKTVLNCMHSWLDWNEYIEQKADWRFRIENIANVFGELCEQIGIEKKPLSKILRLNRREHIDLTWKDLEKEDKELTKKIKEKSKKYGYKVGR